MKLNENEFKVLKALVDACFDRDSNGGILEQDTLMIHRMSVGAILDATAMLVAKGAFTEILDLSESFERGAKTLYQLKREAYRAVDEHGE